MGPVYGCDGVGLDVSGNTFAILVVRFHFLHREQRSGM